MFRLQWKNPLTKISLSIIWYCLSPLRKKIWNKSKWTSVGQWEAKYHTNLHSWLYEEMVSFTVPLKMIEEVLLLFLFCLKIGLVLNLTVQSQKQIPSSLEILHMAKPKPKQTKGKKRAKLSGKKSQKEDTEIQIHFTQFLQPCNCPVWVETVKLSHFKTMLPETRKASH